MVSTSVIFHDSQRGLRQTYNLWVRGFPNSLKWKRARAAKEDTWWDVAAAACQREGLPPALMFYIVTRFLNSRPEDAEVPLSPTVFRSESLIIRAIANFRRRMNDDFKILEPIYILENGQKFSAPKNSLEYARTSAEFAVKYVRLSISVHSYPLIRKGQPVSPAVADQLAYERCDQNPFILMALAQLPKYRAIAAVNCWKYCDLQPWAACAWEGIASPYSFSLLDQLAGCAVEHYYEDRTPVWAWPPRPAGDEIIYQVTDEPPQPSLMLSRFRACAKTDLYLTMRLEAARKGGTAPPQGW